MIGVLVCLTVSLTVFALVALADQRWPDRLERRAPHLRGAPEKASEAHQAAAPAPRRSRDTKTLSRCVGWPAVALVVLPTTLASEWPELVRSAPSLSR